MSKQFASFHVSWRDAKRRPMGFLAEEGDYAKAAAQALEAKLNELAQDGWILDRVIPSAGLTPKQTAAFTIIVFK
jgi:hypothetical protein